MAECHRCGCLERLPAASVLGRGEHVALLCTGRWPHSHGVFGSEHRLPELPSPRAAARQPLGGSGSGSGGDALGTSRPTGSICPSDAAIALRTGAGTRIRPTAFGSRAAGSSRRTAEILLICPEKAAPEQDGERHRQRLGTAQHELQKGSAGDNCLRAAAPLHRSTRDTVGHGRLQGTN